MDSLRFDPLDTRMCEQEPIRYPGAVQPHGALLVVDPVSSTILAASESCGALIGWQAEQLLGKPLASVLGAEAKLALLAGQVNPLQPSLDLTLNGQAFSARSLCNATGQYLVDIEPCLSNKAETEQTQYAIRAGLESLRRLDSSAEICSGTAQLIGKLTGLDHVMVYRFDAQWNGEVIAEAAGPGIASYLGLRFPASDIPKQARELFKDCQVRLITDVHYLPSALVARGDAKAFDLGLSNLRSVSPLHIQYLKNMGVRATLVCALVVRGRLWGLVSCQQKQETWYRSPAERHALGWLCQDVSALLETRLQDELRQRESHLAARRRTLMEAVRSLEFAKLIRAKDNADLLEVVGADGFALLASGSIQTAGITPSKERILQLNQSRLSRHPDANPYASHALSDDLGPGTGDNDVAGALFLTVLRQTAVTMVWFRRERVHKLTWGGDPTKPHLMTASGQLTPRTSFDQYVQEVTGKSEEWLPEELHSAGELVALIEIEALRSSEAFFKTIVNSMTEHIVVLDERGVIVSVNDAWNRFAMDNDAPQLAQSVAGISYRDICTAAEGQPHGAEASAAWNGIEAVLRRQAAYFSLDYPCDSPDRKRWFRMNVYAMQASSSGAIVVHEDITSAKQAEVRREAELNAAQEIASLGTWAWDLGSGAMQWSDALYRIFGYLPGDCVPGYDLLLQAVHPDERDRFIATIDKMRVGDLPLHIETRIVRPDGGSRYIQFQGSARLDAGDATLPLQLSGTVLDITERTEQAIELAQAHKNLMTNQFAMESVGIGIAWTDMVFRRFLYANRYLSDLLGYSVDEMRTLDVTEISPEFPIESIQQGVETILEPRKFTFETTFVTRDRRKIPMEIALYYREWSDDSLPHYVAFITDISSRKVIEQALIKAQVSEAASVAKSAFLANMSHEIRTPMNAIVGMAQMLRRSVLTPPQITQLDQIDVSAEHLLGVIDNILDLSKIEAGKFMLDDVYIDIGAVIQRVKTIVEPHIRFKGLHLAVDNTHLPVPLRGDLTRLSQALINYANNAAKFTDQGTISIRARLVEETDSSQLLRFEVSDTGIGIAPEKLERLFNAFEQADNSTTRDYGGTGLGLAITKRLAELMGGSAGASSTVGAGSTFWFTARLAKGSEQDGSAAALAAVEEDAVAILLRDFQGKRILLAEDDPVNQMVVCMGLDDTGLTIDVADDGAQALDMAKREPYDLVLMDMQMPKMDGLAAAQALRALPEYAEVPIIALTANAFLEDRSQCMAVGMNDFLTKPVYREVLCGTILTWLRQRNSHKSRL